MARSQRVVVFGGTGLLGSCVARLGGRAGHRMVVFGRSADSENVPGGVEAIRGDVFDFDAVDRAVRGADAVVVSLSIPRASRSPFAEVTGVEDLHSRSLGVILAAMSRHGVRRVIKVSAQGVGDSADRTGGGFLMFVALSRLKTAFLDHGRADALLSSTDLDWTIFRPPMLKDGPPSHRVAVGSHLKTNSWTRVAREDVALWILHALEDPLMHRKCLTIAPRRRGARAPVRASDAGCRTNS